MGEEPAVSAASPAAGPSGTGAFSTRPLTTDRLTLRPLTSEDREALAELHAEASFWHYPFGRGWTADETDAFLDRTMTAVAAGEPAVWAVVVTESNELAGWSGLAAPTFLPEILPAIEVGWRLGERFRGQGYATEAGGAWVDHAFGAVLPLGEVDELVSIYQPDNIASGAVMERLGFEFRTATTHPTMGVPLHVTAVTRERWQNGRRSQRR